MDEELRWQIHQHIDRLCDEWEKRGWPNVDVGVELHDMQMAVASFERYSAYVEFTQTTDGEWMVEDEHLSLEVVVSEPHKEMDTLTERTVHKEHYDLEN